ncbi:outer membrane beta-barrel protein, partial [Nonlabens ulvanivorans]|uniref:outer membrane beta-barrel protein n=1 Tax=Nonlabens ulvanivorans TaxID=906888 RepID=UPI00329F1B2F
IRDEQDPEPFNGALGLESADPYNINQERFVNTNKIDAKLDYFYVLNKTSNINFTLGSTVSQQNFSSDIFQITDTDERNELQDPSLRNDNVQYNFTDLFAAVHYKFITGKFTFTPGVTAHSFRTLDFQNDIENVIESQRLVPDLEVRYDIKSSQSLRLSYDQTVTFTDIDNYAEGIIFTNYNSLRCGNNQLEGSLNDRVSLRYNNFNMFNYTTIFGNITYTKQRDAIQSQTQLDGINQISAPINFGLPNESLNGSLSYGKEIRKIQFGVSASGSWSSRNNIINNVEQESININQTYGATARSNFQKGINFDLGYRLNFNDSDNGGFENNSTTNVYSAGIDWQLGKRWLLRGSYDLNDFSSDNGQENTFEFLDASIRYQKPSSRWQYSLIATNLLNAEVNVNNNFGQIATSTTQTFVLPRYVYFQMRFDL